MSISTGAVAGTARLDNGFLSDETWFVDTDISVLEVGRLAGNAGKGRALKDERGGDTWLEDSGITPSS